MYSKNSQPYKGLSIFFTCFILVLSESIHAGIDDIFSL